ncbi:MAG TPA: hypothetical protein VHX66_13800 [Solirubrobacteraceae bacterium]|jgi:hypothetical protein|nr:hypothetical protein [Solirubrobacteraceae bacterium]
MTEQPLNALESESTVSRTLHAAVTALSDRRAFPEHFERWFHASPKSVGAAIAGAAGIPSSLESPIPQVVARAG